MPSRRRRGFCVAWMCSITRRAWPIERRARLSVWKARRTKSGRDEGRGGHASEPRRGVEDHEIGVTLRAAQGPVEGAGARQLGFEGGHVGRVEPAAGEQAQARELGHHHGLLGIGLVHEQLGEAEELGVALGEGQRDAPLGIQVGEQRPAAPFRERDGQVEGDGRLADPPLLACDRQSTCHPQSSLELTEV